MSGLRRRAGARGEDDLQEPLISSEDAAGASRDTDRSTSGAIVPRSVNRIDWEQLVRSLVASCQHGWEAVRDTLCKFLGLPCTQQQAQPSALQEERMEELRQRTLTQYDTSSSTHQDALKQLWSHAFPDTPFGGFRNKQWTDMGWQRDDPSSDFRGAGFAALENLLFMAREEPTLFNALLHKTQGDRAEWEYPFAVAGINLTFMLEEVVGLRDARTAAILTQPATTRTSAGCGFLHLLGQSSNAFAELYCMAFQLLDREWLQMRASYMDFPSVIARACPRPNVPALANSSSARAGWIWDVGTHELSVYVARNAVLHSRRQL
ncbi:hypothetical protein WJX73_005931 [Symbiochloris irregularis]|uniref:ELMO domain-containing protein n=1 Tax=Symbiochloris irregularis TaxID=706552 RepID=A0AAW1P5F2_9CHLO